MDVLCNQRHGDVYGDHEHATADAETDADGMNASSSGGLQLSYRTDAPHPYYLIRFSRQDVAGDALSEVSICIDARNCSAEIKITVNNHVYEYGLPFYTLEELDTPFNPELFDGMRPRHYQTAILIASELLKISRFLDNEAYSNQFQIVKRRYIQALQS